MVNALDNTSLTDVAILRVVDTQVNRVREIRLDEGTQTVYDKYYAHPLYEFQLKHLSLKNAYQLISAEQERLLSEYKIQRDIVRERVDRRIREETLYFFWFDLHVSVAVAGCSSCSAKISRSVFNFMAEKHIKRCDWQIIAEKYKEALELLADINFNKIEK